MIEAAGVVLCGGRSMRMGQPKAWLAWEGRTLLERAVSTLATSLHPIVVCAAPGQPLPPLPSGVIRLDDDPPGWGPLPAMAAALRRVETLGLGEAVVLGVDLPFFTAEMAEFLLESLGPDDQAAVPVSEGRPQMTAAAYRTGAARVAEDLVRTGSFSMMAMLDRISYRRLLPEEYAAHDPAGRVFLNVNTPEAYERILTLNQQVSDPPTGPSRGN